MVHGIINSVEQKTHTVRSFRPPPLAKTQTRAAPLPVLDGRACARASSLSLALEACPRQEGAPLLQNSRIAAELRKPGPVGHGRNPFFFYFPARAAGSVCLPRASTYSVLLDLVLLVLENKGTACAYKQLYPQAGAGTARHGTTAGGRWPRDKAERSRSGVRGYTRRHHALARSAARSRAGGPARAPSQTPPTSMPPPVAGVISCRRCAARCRASLLNLARPTNLLPSSSSADDFEPCRHDHEPN
jgi:hypothetical protein